MRLLAAFGVILLFACATLGVAPASWDQASEADFEKGKVQQSAVSSLGEIRMSREISILLPAGAAPEAISAIVWAGQTIYAGSGTQAVVYEIPTSGAQNKPKTIAELPGAMVASLVWTGKELLAGTGGDGAGIYRIDAAGKVKKLWADPKVKYVWKIVRGPQDELYAATGPEGKVYAVHADGKAEAIYEEGKLAKNIISLTQPSKEGLLYAGTDEKGLVVQIDPRAKTSRVVLDAEEREIASLLIEGGATLHAAAWDAGVVDFVQMYVAPVVLGRGGVPVFNARPVPIAGLKELRVETLGADVVVEGYVHGVG